MHNSKLRVKDLIFLGDPTSPLVSWLESQGCIVSTFEQPLTLDQVKPFEFLISYGYRHIIPKQILDHFPDRAINLHISYLPYNRGADPNFWSFIENTPKGVTIHYLDEGLDTGDIIAQTEMQFGPDETLATTYKKLHASIQALFKEHWPAICADQCPRARQMGTGSYHASADKAAVAHLLVKGWHTPVSFISHHSKM